MEKFIWSDEYSVGIPSDDEHHKKFFSIANDLIDFVNDQNVTKENLVKAVERLVNYGISHFKEEEAHFDLENYRDAHHHVAAHDVFRKRTERYMRALDEPNADIHQLGSEIATFTIYWLSDHILLVDKQYTIFLRAQDAKD
jgi:hemerythrin-like metal-binding protein